MFEYQFQNNCTLRYLNLSNWQVAPNAPSEVDAALHGALVGITPFGCFGDVYLDEATQQWQEIPT